MATLQRVRYQSSGPTGITHEYISTTLKEEMLTQCGRLAFDWRQLFPTYALPTCRVCLKYRLRINAAYAKDEEDAVKRGYHDNEHA